MLAQLENLTESDRIYITTEEGLRIWETICRYLFTVTFIKPEKIIKTVQTLPYDAKEAMMTTAEWLRQEGLKQGTLQKAREDARRMLEKGYPIDDICDITGLSKEEVEELQQVQE